MHVDPLGGWSGDMFVAACLDAFPDLWPAVEAAVSGLDLGAAAACRLDAHNDGTLTGRRFRVAADEPAGQHHAHGTASHHGHHRGHHHDHDHRNAHDHDDQRGPAHGPHRHWAEIRDHLQSRRLDAAVAVHAVGIFEVLAEAEAQVHGVPVDSVAFHEVGAVDSIVDIVAAAVLIRHIDASRWTASPLPLGGGRVRTQHGVLPVPAPATTLLLHGLDTIDDGITGERVTPTGAAVAHYLLGGGERNHPASPRRLRATGIGFGTRTLPGLSNCLRVLAFDTAEPAAQAGTRFAHRELGVIEFEVDDQSAEDLSHGLDHIRAMDGIHDVIQSMAFGKKGRMATHVQVLVAPVHLDAAIAACFTETTTIGLRHHVVRGAVLPRRFETVEIDEHVLHVKAVSRPDGRMTGKTEAADVAAQPGLAARLALRRAGEAEALQRIASSSPSGTSE